MRLQLAIAIAALEAGCAHRIDAERSAAVCDMAQLERPNIQRMPADELEYFTRGTPVHSMAASARSQQLASQALGWLGLAAISAGLIEGFAGDPSTNYGVRTGAYALGGSALGLLAGALTLRLTSAPTLDRARSGFGAWTDRCQTTASRFR
jgi:hypothetical protein